MFAILHRVVSAADCVNMGLTMSVSVTQDISGVQTRQVHQASKTGQSRDKHIIQTAPHT